MTAFVDSTVPSHWSLALHRYTGPLPINAMEKTDEAALRYFRYVLVDPNCGSCYCDPHP